MRQPAGAIELGRNTHGLLLFIIYAATHPALAARGDETGQPRLDKDSTSLMP